MLTNCEELSHERTHSIVERMEEMINIERKMREELWKLASSCERKIEETMRGEQERKMTASDNNANNKSSGERSCFYNNSITAEELLEDFTADVENCKKCASINDNISYYSKQSECNSNDADEFDYNDDQENNIDTNDLEHESEQFRR